MKCFLFERLHEEYKKNQLFNQNIPLIGIACNRIRYTDLPFFLSFPVVKR